MFVILFAVILPLFIGVGNNVHGYVTSPHRQDGTMLYIPVRLSILFFKYLVPHSIYFVPIAFDPKWIKSYPVKNNLLKAENVFYTIFLNSVNASSMSALELSI